MNLENVSISTTGRTSRPVARIIREQENNPNANAPFDAIVTEIRMVTTRHSSNEMLQTISSCTVLR
jgi:hypothetical protein